MIDVAIIGFSLEAATAALHLSSKGKRVCIFPGYQQNYSYAELIAKQDKFFDENFISATYFLKDTVEKLKGFNFFHLINGKVMSISYFEDHFMINAGEEIYQSKIVLLAGSYNESKMIIGENFFFNKGISYLPVSDGGRYIERNAWIYGETKTATSDANYLRDIGVDVTYISKDIFFGLGSGIKKIQGSINCLLGDSRLKYVVINGKKEEVNILFVVRNYTPLKSLVKGLEVNEVGRIIVKQNFETNVPGIYAVGECTGQVIDMKTSIKNAIYVAHSILKYIDTKVFA